MQPVTRPFKSSAVFYSENAINVDDNINVHVDYGQEIGETLSDKDILGLVQEDSQSSQSSQSDGEVSDDDCKPVQVTITQARVPCHYHDYCE